MAAHSSPDAALEDKVSWGTPRVAEVAAPPQCPFPSKGARATHQTWIFRGQHSGRR